MVSEVQESQAELDINPGMNTGSKQAAEVCEVGRDLPSYGQNPEVSFLPYGCQVGRELWMGSQRGQRELRGLLPLKRLPLH